MKRRTTAKSSKPRLDLVVMVFRTDDVVLSVCGRIHASVICVVYGILGGFGLVMTLDAVTRVREAGLGREEVAEGVVWEGGKDHDGCEREEEEAAPMSGDHDG